MDDISFYGSTGSFHRGNLPEGCKKCLKGEKVVLYTTGRCTVGCKYCTIGEERKSIDSMHINEIPLQDRDNIFDSIIQEISLCEATGAGITGGDPLEVPDRTISFIRGLKSHFGSSFHIHLYTSAKLLTTQLLAMLVEAGLDELRIHPKNLIDEHAINVALSAKSTYPSLIVGLEVPGIPGKNKELSKLIEIADSNNLDFININELEFTTTNFEHLEQSGFISLPTNSAVQGSHNMVESIFEEKLNSTRVPLHFCSSGSKDAIQLTQRFRRRAHQVAKPFQSISEEGELEYGELYLERDQELTELYEMMREVYEIPDEMLELDLDNGLIATDWLIVKELISELRDEFPSLKAAVMARHPIDNGPITWYEPQ